MSWASNLPEDSVHANNVLWLRCPLIDNKSSAGFDKEQLSVLGPHTENGVRGGAFLQNCNNKKNPFSNNAH